MCGGREWIVCICLKNKNVINTEKKNPETTLLFLASEEGERYFQLVGFFVLFCFLYTSCFFLRFRLYSVDLGKQKGLQRGRGSLLPAVWQ